MKILIAGGAGYIGSVLAPKLLERGYEVTVVDLQWFGNHLPPEIPVIQQDVLNLTEDELAGFDQVIFMAGLSNDPMAEYSPSQNFTANGAAPAFLAYIAKRAGVRRYIHLGSCSVYGYSSTDLCNESSQPECNFPYGISKLQGEQGCMHLADKNFSVISLRQGTVSGYSPRMRLDLVVNAMFRSALAEGRVRVNNPAIWRPVLGIQDAAGAYIASIEARPDVSGVFNIASGNFTVGEIGAIVKQEVERLFGKPIQIEVLQLQEYRSYKVSTAKAGNVLSFAARQDIQAIVNELAQNLDAFRDFDNPAYYNIETFKALDARRNTQS
jgi:nucleoside-diphosphate-sugar epimerase